MRIEQPWHGQRLEDPSLDFESVASGRLCNLFTRGPTMAYGLAWRRGQCQLLGSPATWYPNAGRLFQV